MGHFDRLHPLEEAPVVEVAAAGDDIRTGKPWRRPDVSTAVERRKPLTRRNDIDWRMRVSTRIASAGCRGTTKWLITTSSQSMKTAKSCTSKSRAPSHRTPVSHFPSLGVDPLSWTPEDWGRESPRKESTC